MYGVLDRVTVDLLKEFDTDSLSKLAGLLHGLQLAFGPAEGFQTAFRTLIHQAGKDCIFLSCSSLSSTDCLVSSAVTASHLCTVQRSVLPGDCLSEGAQAGMQESYALLHVPWLAFPLHD